MSTQRVLLWYNEKDVQRFKCSPIPIPHQIRARIRVRRTRTLHLIPISPFFVDPDQIPDHSPLRSDAFLLLHPSHRPHRRIPGRIPIPILTRRKGSQIRSR
jgi:hypothetical protein